MSSCNYSSLSFDIYVSHSLLLTCCLFFLQHTCSLAASSFSENVSAKIFYSEMLIMNDNIYFILCEHAFEGRKENKLQRLTYFTHVVVSPQSFSAEPLSECRRPMRLVICSERARRFLKPVFIIIHRCLFFFLGFYIRMLLFGVGRWSMIARSFTLHLPSLSTAREVEFQQGDWTDSRSGDICQG